MSSLDNQIIPMDRTRYIKRLHELAQLQLGWLNGEGQVIDTEIVNYVFSIFSENNLPFPYLYPRISGGILLEWIFDQWDVSLEIESISSQLEYQAVNLVTDETIELTIPFWSSDIMRKKLTRVFAKLN
jgi:hypothetical protein